MDISALYINRDADYDWLTALPYGRVSDGQPDQNFLYVGESFRWCMDGPAGRVIGFEIVNLRDFDASLAEYAEIWEGPRFDAPLLGLLAATAGEIVVAAHARFAHESTLNREYFDRAVASRGEEALLQWRLCLECGDSMAHYGLGYTLVDVDRPLEAYVHLRYYVGIEPTNAWAWCWLGKTCAARGEIEEARGSYRRALALEAAGASETDARELLEELEEQLSRGR